MYVQSPSAHPPVLYQPPQMPSQAISSGRNRLRSGARTSCPAVATEVRSPLPAAARQPFKSQQRLLLLPLPILLPPLGSCFPCPGFEAKVLFIRALRQDKHATVFSCITAASNHQVP